MLKKRFLLISLPLLVTLTIICLLVARAELAKEYIVCKNRMLSFESCGVWEYKSTRLNFFSSMPIPNMYGRADIVFIFSYGSSHAYCSVYWDSSGWHENIWMEGEICLDRPEEKYSVSP